MTVPKTVQQHLWNYIPGVGEGLRNTWRLEKQAEFNCQFWWWQWREKKNIHGKVTFLERERILLKMGLEPTYITPEQRNYMHFTQALGFCGSLSWDTMGQFIWQRRFWALTGLMGTTGMSLAAYSQFTKNSKGRHSRKLWKTFIMARKKECV